MSADIINLRQARKAKRRSEREKTAAQNRARFALTGAERARLRDEEARTLRRLDGLHLQHNHENPSIDTGHAGGSED
ncbi:MAG TPA: DUF4169 family protein [Hyphomicrobiaceae bacterium]|nr:DUF4169 family protein [Hyphomicrobiaceae bacterium]